MISITVYNESNLPTADIDEFNELQEDFKVSDPEKNRKLQLLIVSRGFKYSFKAWKDPDGKLWIIDAHQRKKALQTLRSMGMNVPPIPYELIHCDSKKEAVEEIAAYNSEFAEKNPDTLLFQKYEITESNLELAELSFNPITFTPEKIADIDTYIDSKICGIDTDDIEEDDTENLNAYSSQTGDLWLLGKHRLLVGDCRKNDDMRTLMNRHVADMCITDPPYNVNYSGGTSDELVIDNDNVEKDVFRIFIDQVFGVIARNLKAGAPVYIFHADTEGRSFREAFVRHFKFAQCCH